MQYEFSDTLLAPCRTAYEQSGFVPLPCLYRAAIRAAGEIGFEEAARTLCAAFNGAAPAQARIAAAARAGDPAAEVLADYMRRAGLDGGPLAAMPAARFHQMQQKLDAQPHGFLEAARPGDFYPWDLDGNPHGYPLDRVFDRLARGRARFDAFAAARRSDTAILAGNGPSLRQMDFGLFRGQDLFISNYAVRNAALRDAATGVAVSNPLVAEQEPHVFLLNDLWKFHPFWLGHALDDTDRTVWLDAQGGEMFFSTDVRRRIAWHSTVTFFWLQILYSAGYRKVLLVGVDNSYVQKKGVREGDVLRQEGDDPNHFDPGYFRGRLWQAADTGRMAETYALARDAYAADGREIVNCGIGGKLELFRRARLEDELPLPRPLPPAAEPQAEPAGDAAARLLELTARLLLDPRAARDALKQDPGLAADLAKARNALPARDPRRIQFEKAWAWASD